MEFKTVNHDINYYIQYKIHEYIEKNGDSPNAIIMPHSMYKKLEGEYSHMFKATSPNDIKYMNLDVIISMDMLKVMPLIIMKD